MCRLLIALATLVAERKLLSTGSVLVLHRLVAPRDVVSSQTREQTRVQCIGRWILYHWTTREVPLSVFQLRKSVSFNQDPRVSFNGGGGGWGAM